MYLLTIEFPAMKKCLETLKLEVSTGVWFHVRGLGHDQTEVNQSAPWSETIMRRQIHIFDEFVLFLVWIVDVCLSCSCSIWAEKLHWLDNCLLYCHWPKYIVVSGTAVTCCLLSFEKFVVNSIHFLLTQTILL
jgi:hypothetical protein